MAAAILFAALHARAAEVLRLSFDEGNGTNAADSALSDGTPTPDDSATLRNGATFVPGKFGTALDLSGTNAPWGYAVFANASLGDMMTNVSGATFSCWLMVTNTLWQASTNNDKGDLIFIGLPIDGSKVRFEVQIGLSAAIRIFARCNDTDPQTFIITGPNQFHPNQWVHIAGVANFAGKYLTIYTNGQIALKTTGITNWGVSPTVCSGLKGTNASVGANWPLLTEAFIGRMDEVRFWNEPLSDAQVAAVYAEVPGPTKLAITSVNGGISPAINSAFNVVVEAQNAAGTAQTVTSNTAVSLSLNTGSGTLGGTLTGTITAGTSSVTISGVTYTIAESGVVVTATRTSGDILTAANSSPFTVSGWYNASWTHRIAIVIDHTQISGPLTNFPVLINITNASLKASAQFSGNDILFASVDGTTKLDHEIESYTNSNGALVAWVKVPLLSSTVDTTLYLYFGNTGSTNQQNATAVWNANFKGVWHLKESPGNFGDSTVNGNTGTNVVSAVGKTGIISSGQQFDSTKTNYIDAGSFDPSAADLTISLWARWNGVNGQHQTLVAKRDLYSAAKMRWEFVRDSSGTLRFISFASTADFAVDVPDTNNWHLYVVTRSGTTCNLYMDGSAYGSTATLASYGTNTTAQVLIGGNFDLKESWSGYFDEVRISGAAQSTAWVATEYNNQSSPGAFYNLGSPEQPPPTQLAITSVNVGSSPTAGTAFNIVVQAQDTGGLPQLVDINTAVTLSLNAGSGTLGGTLTGTMMAGTSSLTISNVTYTKAENGVILTVTENSALSLTPGNSSPFTVIAGIFAKLQLLMPGETASPGSASGTTGTPTAQVVGTAFAVTVKAVDANWNISSTNDTVAITSSDGVAMLPANAALVAGTKTFSVTLNTAGTPTVTASDMTHAGITADTSPSTTVNKGIQTITFPSPGDQAYGVAPITLGATASSGLIVTYSVTSGPATVSNNVLTITGAGSVTNQASQAGNANWNAATSLSQGFTVAQTPLTGNITANNKTYDRTNTATIASRTLTGGVVGADVVTLTNGIATFADKNVGNARTVTAITLSLTGANAANYVLASTSATTKANITAVGLTVTGVTASNKVYDGSTSATVSTNGAALVGVVGGDIVTLGGTAAGTFATSAAGTSKTITVSGLALVGADAANYTLTPPATTANITLAGTLNAVTSSLNPALPSSNIAFTATLSVVSPGGGTPTGNVIFKDGTTAFGTNAVNGSAVAIFSTTALSHGSHTITAEYAGDGNFVGSTNSLSQVVNARPITVGDVLQCNPNTGAKVRTAILLANDTDPDGDALTFISVSATSASGCTNVLHGNWITYTPPLGFTNADSFSYIIADSYGLQATGTVSVAILVDSTPAQNIGSIDNLGNNSSLIHFSGIPGRTYSVQYTTNLVTPVWQSLGTNTADAFGKINFTDSPATNSPPRFYRSTNP